MTDQHGMMRYRIQDRLQEKRGNLKQNVYLFQKFYLGVVQVIKFVDTVRLWIPAAITRKRKIILPFNISSIIHIFPKYKYEP